jgi:phosphoglycolate phosphatase
MSNPTLYRGALLFDLDGTLVDTSADFVAVVNSMREKDGLQALPEQDIRNTVSDGARALVKLAYNLDDGDDGFAEKRQQLLDQYEAELGMQAKLFDGFHQLLNALERNNIAWGIVTNKPSRFTDPLLARLHIRPSNGVAICPDHVTHSKPHAEPLLLAATKLGLAPAQCVYAGDHLRDIEAGRNAGMTTVACAYGYIKPVENINHWQADVIVNSVTELHQFAQQHFKLV